MNDDASAPLLCSLLRSRATCAALFAAGAAHVALNAAELSGWPCPFRTAFGLPCPGCGLGRASALLLHGEARLAMAMHPFAPVFLAVVVMGVVITLLPWRQREAGIAMLERFESRTRFTLLLLSALLVYWAARIALDLWRGAPLFDR